MPASTGKLLVQAPYLATPLCHNFTQFVCLKTKDVLEISEIIIEKFRRNGGEKVSAQVQAFFVPCIPQHFLSNCPMLQVAPKFLLLCFTAV